MMKFALLPIALSLAVLVNGDIVPTGQIVEFDLFNNESFCLVVAGNENGASVSSTTCIDLPTDNTLWTVVNGGLSTGPITIFGDKCLDVRGGVNKDGTKLQIWTCGKGNKNQQFQVDNDRTIRWAGTNKCLDNTGGAISNGNPTQVWTCGNNNNNQKWLAIDGDTFGTPPNSVVNFFMPKKDGTGDGCITATDNVSGSPVVFGTCDFTDGPGEPNQHFTISGGAPVEGPGTVGTLQVFGDKCLELPNGNTANGVKLHIATCVAGNANQKWLVNGDATIQWAGGNKCVDLTGGSQAENNPIQSWTCGHINKNQEWFIIGP